MYGILIVVSCLPLPVQLSPYDVVIFLAGTIMASGPTVGPARPAATAPGKTKDDAYDMFMKEIQGIM